MLHRLVSLWSSGAVRLARAGWPLSRVGVGLVPLLVAGLGRAAPEAAPGAAPATAMAGKHEPLSDWKANLTLVEEYRLRRASNVLVGGEELGGPPAPEDQTDHMLRLQSDARIEGAEEHFLGLFSGALWWDLDGYPARGTPNLFVTQYADRNPWLAPYALSVEWRKSGLLDHLRLGRQDAEHGMPLTFDGASLGVRAAEPLLLYAFGGQTVHFFETTPGLLENWVVSSGAVLRPMLSLELEADARFIQDQVADWETPATADVTTHSYGLSVATRTEGLYGKTYARGIDDQLSHAGGAMRFASVEQRFGLDARIDAQLVRLDEIVESEAAFFSLLGPSLPFARYRFEAWKELGTGNDGEPSWFLHLGWRGRQLLSDDPQPFNRNGAGIYLHARADDLIERGVFVGATGEYSYVPGSIDDGWRLAVGGSAGYRGPALKTEVGTYWERYKINYYRKLEELESARSIYASAAYRVAAWLELRARYEMDIVDRYLETFTLALRQDF